MATCVSRHWQTPAWQTLEISGSGRRQEAEGLHCLPCLQCRLAPGWHRGLPALQTMWQSRVSLTDGQRLQVGHNYFRLHPKGVGLVCKREAGFPPLTFVEEYLGEVHTPWRWFEIQVPLCWK